MPDRYAALARALGLSRAGSDLELASAGVDRLAALSRECGLPQTLSEVGIPERALPRLAAQAVTVQRLLRNNPRPIAERDAESLYRAAFA
jgi:alcohol dehydrogenase class IV